MKVGAKLGVWKGRHRVLEKIEVKNSHVSYFDIGIPEVNYAMHI